MSLDNSINRFYPNSSFIGLGSNLGDRGQYLTSAIEALSQLPKTELIRCSSLYQSDPMGPADQPRYLNAVAELHTQLSELELLDNLQRIETTSHRVRGEERWGPRTLDLDLILHQNKRIDLPRLVVPHYGMKERSFVLLPLHEIAPDLYLPDGTELTSLVNSITKTGIERLS